MTLLRLKDLSFRFRGTKKAVLSNINVEVHAGDRILLYGDSGSGKSTLLAIMAALAPEYVGGELSGVRELLYTRKGVVLQNPEAQIITPTVEEEIAFPLENQGMDPDLIRRKVQAQLKGFQLEPLKARLPLSLSGGECQRISLATALVQEPDILFLDEPTSYLDEDRARQFFEDLEKLPASTAVVLVEHRFELAAPFCTQWYRLAKGVLEVQTAPPVLWPGLSFLNGSGGDFLGKQAPELEAHTPELGAQTPEPGARTPDPGAQTPGPPLLRVQDLHHRYPETEDYILRDINFTLTKGEILAIQGSSGSGKTTLLKKIIGLLKNDKNTIYIQGKDIALLKPQRYYQYVAYVSQNPEHLFVSDTVQGELDSAGPEGLSLARRFRLDHLLTRNPWKLSEGEKRRLTLCIALAMDRDLIVMDEPTYGLDQESRKDLADLMIPLLEDRRTLLIVSHDTPFLRALPCRILRLTQGRLFDFPLPARNSQSTKIVEAYP